MNRLRVARIAGLLAGVIVLIGLLPVTVRTERRYTCALCRAERVDSTLFGLPWSTHRDREFTKWYEDHQPAHEHIWGWQGTICGMSLFGGTTYRGCGVRHPVCEVPESLLLEYCEQADRATLDAYFAGISSDDPEVQQRTAQSVCEYEFPQGP